MSRLLICQIRKIRQSKQQAATHILTHHYNFSSPFEGEPCSSSCKTRCHCNKQSNNKFESSHKTTLAPSDWCPREQRGWWWDPGRPSSPCTCQWSPRRHVPPWDEVCRGRSSGRGSWTLPGCSLGLCSGTLAPWREINLTYTSQSTFNLLLLWE